MADPFAGSGASIDRVRVHRVAAFRRRGPALLLASAWLAFAPSGRAENGDAEARRERAAEHFRTLCTTCHGPTGQPDPDSAVVEALGVVPANLADPLFNSREPKRDWMLVIRDGGSALGLSDRMPAFGGQLDEREIQELVLYLKTLSGEHGYPSGDLNFFLPLRTRKAFPEDEWVWKLRFTDQDERPQWRNTLEFEKRIGRRFQSVLELTHRVDDGDGSFEKFEAGGKYVLFSDADAGFIATAGATVGFPLEDERSVRRDTEILPFLAFGKWLGPSFTVQASTRAKLPVDRVRRGGVELSGIVHWVHTPWPRAIFPGLELFAEIPFDHGAGAARVDFAQVSILPQVRVGLSKRGHVALNLGVELPLNERDRYDSRAYLDLIWDFADGPFWAGW